jgi:glycerophosphoryl diester phosphodiesterase
MMPTLQQMLEAVEDMGMILMLESKRPGTMARIEPIVRPFRSRVIVISFFGDELVEATSQRLETGPLMAHCPSRVVAKAMVTNYRCTRFLLDRWYVNDTVEMLNGFDVPQQRIAFTVNDGDAARQMLDLGFDAVLSDNPDHLAQLPGCEPG